MHAPPDDEPWYVTAFRSDYRTVYPHRGVQSARREAAFLVEAGVRGRVLDLCCGFGRHTLALLEAGLDAYGLDLSSELLAAAAELERGGRLAGRLVRADAQLVPFARASFDSVVNLFSSFGYFGDAGDARVLDEIGRVARPGARVVLDLMNPTRVRAELVPESVTDKEGARLRERRALSADGRRVTKEVELTLADGRTRQWREDVRMYPPAELEGLLAARGFSVERVVGGFDGEPFGPQAERQLVLARAG